MLDRNVTRVARTRTPTGLTTDTAEPEPQEKLIKYFPAEALALYSGLDPLTRTAFSGAALRAALWASLAVSIGFCWLYLERFWLIRRWQQRTFSCGALVLYSAALGGPFTTLSWYKPVFGVIAALIATSFIIFVRSPPEKPSTK